MFKDHRQSRCLVKLALLFFLLGQLTKQSTSKNTPPGCSKITENSTRTSCDCQAREVSYMDFEYEYECRVIGTASRISINFQWRTSVTITCFGLDLLDYSLLPNFTESSSSALQIVHCPLPPKQPIHRIFSKLGLTDVQEFVFESGGALHRTHFAGMQNLRRLGLRSIDTSNLPGDLLADLGNLRILDLSNNYVDPSLNIFSPLENLENLNLINNSLHDLPPGIFKNKNKLTQLILHDNDFVNLTKKASEGVSSTRELRLSSNGVVAFPPNIETLVLDRNHIASLPGDLFAINKNLVTFTIYEDRTQLKQLPGRLLGNLPKLKVVSLTCGLETIPGDLLVNSKHIWIIDISENNLTELPLTLFADQIELDTLDLSRNQLMSLPDGVFQNTTLLSSLKLSHNHLVTITHNIFSALSNLERLYLDNNDIFTLQSEPFLHTKNLIRIDLQNNKISGELSALNLSISLPFLLELDLSYNNITTVNFDLDSVDGASVVNVSYNSIHKIFLNGTCYSLKIMLDLSHNPIDCDCELLSFVQFLKSEYATDYIDRLGGSFDMFECSYPKSLEGRKVFQLSPQELICPLDRKSSSARLCPESCSCWVRPVDGIAIVNCSSANLSEMPVLPRLPLAQLSLQQIHGTELHIENSRLTQLPNANTPGYIHVVELHASNNSLTEVLAINLPKNLTLLDLSRNNIQHLHDTTLSVLDGGRITVALAGNPWICDCAARGLLRFVLLNNKLIRDVEQMECEDGQKFQDSPPNMICSANQNLVIAAGVVIAVIGLCAGITAAFYYKYQQEIKVWLYARGMCLWFVTEEDLDKDKRYDAFISYSHRDEDFIADQLLPELENGPAPFKLCLHSRDWIVGEFIADQIMRSVEESRRTIIVLSPNFLESNWARMEFRAAHTAALKEWRARVIVILYGDVGDIGSLDPDLKAYLQMNTYVEWGDPWFWKKLRYAMPHPSTSLPGFVNADTETSTDNPITLSLITPPEEEASRNTPTN